MTVMPSIGWKEGDCFVGDFKRLIKRMGMGRRYVLLLLLRAPFDGARAWMLAALMKSVFRCLEAGEAEGLPEICVSYGILCALLFCYNGTVWSLYAAFAARAEAALRGRLLERILKLGCRQVEARARGEWMTRLGSDARAAFEMMNGPLNIPHAVVAILNTTLSSALLLGGSPLLAGVAWLWILPHLVLHERMVLRAIPGLKEESQRAMAQCTSAIGPLIEEADAIRIYDAGGLLLADCARHSRSLMAANLGMHRRGALGGMLTRIFGIGGYFSMLLSGALLMEKGCMSFSDVVYCFQVRGSMLAGLFMLIASLGNLRANGVCVKRVNEVLDE